MGLMRDHILLEGQNRLHMGSSICTELTYLGPGRGRDPEWKVERTFQTKQRTGTDDDGGNDNNNSDNDNKGNNGDANNHSSLLHLKYSSKLLHILTTLILITFLGEAEMHRR